RFATAAAEAGVDGVLTVDLPPEEAGPLQAALKPRGLDTIFLLAPTSSTVRIKRIARAAHGFIYYVSLRGVTGAANLNVAEVAGKLNEIRQHTKLPLGVGFGINGPEAAAQVAETADAVIVGSAVVRRMEEMAGNPDKILNEVPAFIARLRAAMDRVTLAPKSATGANR
ncbi:MAG TPA: tryptophan synthase subunit alpha, partial [Sulfuricaulis sp.]